MARRQLGRGAEPRARGSEPRRRSKKLGRRSKKLRPARPFAAFARHSREGGSPATLLLVQERTARHWIPAFAGMTGGGHKVGRNKRSALRHFGGHTAVQCASLIAPYFTDIADSAKQLTCRKACVKLGSGLAEFAVSRLRISQRASAIARFDASFEIPQKHQYGDPRSVSLTKPTCASASRGLLMKSERNASSLLNRSSNRSATCGSSGALRFFAAGFATVLRDSRTAVAHANPSWLENGRSGPLPAAHPASIRGRVLRAQCDARIDGRAGERQ